MESVATEVTGNVATSTVNYVLGYLKRKYGYVSNLKENWAKLEKEKGYLCDKEADVTNNLEKDEETMEETAECKTWLKEVKDMKAKLEELRKKDDNISRCFCGLCPFHSLLKLGKDVVTYTTEVTALCDRQQKINIMVKREKAPPIRVRMKHPKKIDDVPSLNDHVEKLLKWLKGDNFKRLRIWGLPGVGKTTIMKNLNNRVRETQQFDIVLFVDVSEAKSMGEEMREVMREEIQEQLVKRLQLGAQSDQIPDEISKNLVDQRYLLLLDGVYSEIDLNDIGIHDNHELGKVVFATRYRNVYRSSTDEEINITRLSENDGQNLFKKLLGDIEVDQPDSQPIVKGILRECGGMPQVIMIIANMLRDMLIDENYLASWRDVLCQLQVPSTDPMGEMEEVYKAFKTVYDRLNRDCQPCLRYWTIFPPDYEVHEDYMTECWKAEQFLARAETLGNARDRGQRIFYELEDKSLLEKGRKARHFKMPFFLQRMAVRIRDQEEEDSKFLVGEGGKILEGEELLEKWESAQRVSLIRQKFTLPQKLASDKTLTLLLQKNPNLTEIPESFFESMCNLRILDLCNTGIMSMPPSISNLKNLRLLYLNNCGHIVELPPNLQQLKSLEILDLRNTGILTLPKEIGQLTGLKCLRVSFKKNCSCSNGINGQPLLMIPCNVIASLSSLEELSIDVNYKNKIWNQIVDTVAGEVAKLKKLASLCFYFPELTCFEAFTEARNRNYMEQEDHGLRSFRIVVGNHNMDNFLGFDFFGYTTERHLRFATGGVIPNAFSNVLKQGYSLELLGHHSAKNLSVIGAANLEGLKACTIEECDEMESIIGGESGDIVTGALQKLHLINLPKLVSICEDLNESRSLNKITTLTLQGCPRLKRLFPQALVQLLCNLKDLQVKDCSKIEEIIEGGSIVEIGALPKLKNVVLCKLPRLFRICEDVSFEWLSLETMKIQNCPDLKHLPFSMENATRLRVIECTENWWSQLVWPDDSVQDRLKGLRSFT
ncbi:probable disease resistance protein At4g27220 [Quercus lobata]|nr:probable disease resistance protein At4g27220 [Quercus lobata]